MLKLISLGSSSKGNCHILYNGKESIMLDCGINMRKHNYEIMNFNIIGILITHSHKDHCRGLKDKTYLGNQNVYSNRETLGFLGDSVLSYRKKEIKEMKRFNIGSFTIIPIEVIHDVKNFGYIIMDSISKQKVAYFTDLGYADSISLKGINHWIIECNHIREEVQNKYDNLSDSDNRKPYYSRVLSDSGHLSLEDSCNLIKNSYTDSIRNVILCHISSSESDYKRFEDIYKDKLKSLETPLNCLKIHAINNSIRTYEVLDLK